MELREYGPAWLWPNLLSLDAPFIAMVWQDFLARCYSTPLWWAGRIILGLTVWAIYLADRLLDVRHPASSPETVRHSARAAARGAMEFGNVRPGRASRPDRALFLESFYRQNRTSAFALLIAIVAVDLVLSLNWLRSSLFVLGLPLAACVALYLTVFPLARRGVAAWKKPIAALLFTSGTFLVSWARTDDPFRLLAAPAFVFFLLCLANLQLMGNVRHVAIAMFLFSLTLITAGNSPWCMAVLISAAGLGLIAFAGRRISGNARCFLADAVLLSPLLMRLIGQVPG